jgi:hypothetical protein
MQYTLQLRNSVLLVLFLTTVASAQTFRGTLLGTVTDPNNAVVPGAKVTVKNTSTGLERSTISDDAGNYTVAELPIGSYEVRVEQTGFVAGVVSNVTVEVAGERRVDVKLSVSAANAVVMIAPNMQAETTSNTLGLTITTKAAEDLPINGRDFTKFLVMAPGATGDPSGATDSPGSFGLFSANGNRGRANNYLLDGTDMNDGYRNLPAINEAGLFRTTATIQQIEAKSEEATLSLFEP